MKRSLSPMPSLSLRLDQIQTVREVGSAMAEPAIPRWRAAADGLGMAMFFVLLAAYLVARLA
jgi:hypothetical protein